ncbi:hypothetical protein DFQ11_1011015 [Winogradskyella epiphytica]|uniref:Surface antigen-like protein n=1 Tax=Winogradskyella epiphytica TaxID=262005 RepID=A0A2V4XXR1_9FLAO|nr:DUF5686 family protein [Winogradskyella epiphytica]PYE83577.1 hypothetical protein DFQ11_1011015 [Winogradskyella epiphytica]GGW59130.1 hypothetical protein GCM10008085_08690 [Winogradskyella epiphytica]
MLKHLFVVFLLIFATNSYAQEPIQKEKDSVKVAQDSIKKAAFLTNIGNGFLPFKYFNADLRYLIKFNQYEGFRTGLGGITNNNFSERYRIDGYIVYGFKDKKLKYKIGGGFRIKEKSNTWVNLAYVDDLQETGSSTFLTDKRFFTFFEPRLLNIDLFHRHITKSVALEHKISNHLLSETEVAYVKVNPTYNYTYILDDTSYKTFDLSTAKIALQWSPFSTYVLENDKIRETKDGYPKFTLQLTQGFKSVFGSDFQFSKLDFRTIQQFKHFNGSVTNLTLVAGIAGGEAPLTHLYHAYPNNINKETILQRFSVAGLNSFETMYFNEFFSDKFSTLQLKHFFKPFNITHRFKPQLVLISRHAVGDMNSKDSHQGIAFNTLDKLYSESGFEINKLLLGFGLSFAYRYGSYHLPSIGDNFAFKFTFNLAL